MLCVIHALPDRFSERCFVGVALCHVATGRNSLKGTPLSDDDRPICQERHCSACKMSPPHLPRTPPFRLQNVTASSLALDLRKKKSEERQAFFALPPVCPGRQGVIFLLFSPAMQEPPLSQGNTFILQMYSHSSHGRRSYRERRSSPYRPTVPSRSWQRDTRRSSIPKSSRRSPRRLHRAAPR